MIRIPHGCMAGRRSRIRPAFTILSISVVAMAMIGAFVLIDGQDPVGATVTGSGSCGEGVTWELDDTGTLTIQYSGPGTGEMTSYTEPYGSGDNSPWYLSTAVKKVVIEDGVTSIGDYAFFECGSLTSVIIGDSVESIGEYAFYGCYSLTSVTIPDKVESIGVMAFSGCGSLTSVIIGDSVESIGREAFYGCYNLTSVTIPDSVESIGTHAFAGCTGLLEISFGEKSSPGGAFPNHKFYSEDGTELTDLTENSDFSGFTFVGLSIDRMIRTIEHGVTYDIDGGSEDAPAQDDVREGRTFTVKGYIGTKTGYAFGGWSYGGETYREGDAVTMGGEDITLVAVWTPVNHRVVYDLNGGSGIAPTQDDVQEGQTFQVRDFDGTKIGYAFGGWSWNGSTYKAGDTIEMGASDIVLESVWMKNPIFVPIPDPMGDEPVVIPDRTHGDDGKDSTSAVIVAAGCVMVLLAILVLVGSSRIGR